MTGSLCELSPRRVALVQRRRRLVGSLGKPREELFDPHRLLNPGQTLEIVRQTVVPHLPAEEHEGTWRSWRMRATSRHGPSHSMGLIGTPAVIPVAGLSPAIATVLPVLLLLSGIPLAHDHTSPLRAKSLEPI